MRRLNLARNAFLDTRPVWLLGGLLTFAALLLTALSVVDLLAASGREAALGGRVASLRERHERLRSEVEQINRRLGQVQWAALRTEAASLQDVVAKRQLEWTAMLADLERLVPWDVRLTSISPSIGANDAVTLALAGVAADRAAWLQLLARSFTDPNFSDPIPAGESAPAQGTGEGYDFRLTVRYWPEGRP